MKVKLQGSALGRPQHNPRHVFQEPQEVTVSFEFTELRPASSPRRFHNGFPCPGPHSTMWGPSRSWFVMKRDVDDKAHGQVRRSPVPDVAVPRFRTRYPHQTQDLYVP